MYNGIECCFRGTHCVAAAFAFRRLPFYCTMGNSMAPFSLALPYSSGATAAMCNRLCRHSWRSCESMSFIKSLIIRPPTACAATSDVPRGDPRSATSTSLRLPSNGELDNLKVPALHCTFPSLIHPYYHSLKETCDAWIEMLVDPPTPTARRFLHDCLLPRLVCQFIPTAQLAGPRLMHVIKFVSWLMVADDDDDHPDVRGSNYDATKCHAGLILAILRKCKSPVVITQEASMLQAGKTRSETKSAIMLGALKELWEEMSAEMSPSLQTRFMSTMADYLEGIKVQALYRSQMCVPNMESYLDIRRQSSFTIPCFVLIEYALGIELDDTAFHSPLIQELRSVVLDYISLCNDVVSCNIEVKMGDYFNLPFILYGQSTEKFESFQSALDYVAQITEDLNAQAISLLSTIFKESKHFEPHMIPFVHAYAYALCISMSGTLTWFLETARYKQPQERAMLINLSHPR